MHKANTRATKNCLPNQYVLPNTLSQMTMETQVIKKKEHICQGSKCQTPDCHSDLYAYLSFQKLKLPPLPGIKQNFNNVCKAGHANQLPRSPYQRSFCFADCAS
jgi:hypothetical protein